jgi:hypothetical protein
MKRLMKRSRKNIKLMEIKILNPKNAKKIPMRSKRHPMVF